jgi:hypothetical protein
MIMGLWFVGVRSARDVHVCLILRSVSKNISWRELRRRNFSIVRAGLALSLVLVGLVGSRYVLYCTTEHYSIQQRTRRRRRTPSAA